MITCDSSVLIAAFARWHSEHAAATEAIPTVDALVEHTVIEAFSVLTRLPPPRRAPAALVVQFLDHHFPAGTTRLAGPGSGRLLDVATRAGITGGAVYDLLIGLAAEDAETTLLTLDRRAAATYRAAGAPYRVLAAPS